MTLTELLKSDYAKIFEIKDAGDIIMLFKPQTIGIDKKGLNITVNDGYIWLEKDSNFSITLYKESKTTHITLF